MHRSQQSTSDNWADDVEQQERKRDAGTGGQQQEDWHTNMNVERGAARHRLNLNHGFVQQVVGWRMQQENILYRAQPCAQPCAQIRNQRDRDAYEQQWREAYEQADEYGKKWGRVKVPEYHKQQGGGGGHNKRCDTRD